MSENKFEIVDTHPQEAIIKVIGVGGCGGNAVDHMIEEGIEGVEFICANTDAQALQRNKSHTQLQLGANVTKGLGAGARASVGAAAAPAGRRKMAYGVEDAMEKLRTGADEDDLTSHTHTASRATPLDSTHPLRRQSTDRIRLNLAMLSNTPSGWGVAPPDKPVPAPRATTGTECCWQRRITAHTCSKQSGKTTTPGSALYPESPSHS